MFLVCGKIMYLHRFHCIWAQLTPSKPSLGRMTQARLTRGKPSQGKSQAQLTPGNPSQVTESVQPELRPVTLVPAIPRNRWDVGIDFLVHRSMPIQKIFHALPTNNTFFNLNINISFLTLLFQFSMKQYIYKR